MFIYYLLWKLSDTREASFQKNRFFLHILLARVNYIRNVMNLGGLDRTCYYI